MANWVRLWEDMPTDPKWRVVAKRAGRPIAEVLSVFVFMMTNAGANATERGELSNWSDEDVAAALDMETEHVEAIRCAMQGKTLDGQKLSGWEKRQPKREDGAAERSKQWRERNRTQANAQERPYADADADADKKNNSSGGPTICVPAAAAALPSADLKKQLEQATGWADLRNIEAIGKLVADGFSLDDRIIPLARSIAEDHRRRKADPPTSWAFLDKPVRDPSRQAKPCSKSVEMAFVPVGSAAWNALLAAGKRESFLRGQCKRAENGADGLFWPVRDLPTIQTQTAA